MKKSAKEIAVEFKNKCEELGWEYNTDRGILTITKKISDAIESFVMADSQYYSILGIVPTTRAGSTWGTDGGGVGAVFAQRNNLFVMNRSGCSIRVLNALNKLDGK